MPRARPPVNPEVLKWAVEESGYSPEDLAASLNVDTVTIESWLAGDSGPTQGQFTSLAKRLRRPKTIFFLPKPPETGGVPPELRSAVGRTRRQLSADELLWVRRARRMQRLLSLLEQDEGDAAVTIPQLPREREPTGAGERLRDWLGVTLGEQLAWETPREAFDAWRDAFEHRGVFVMQLQLGGQGLRGFALADPHAPLVAVNTRENLHARIFTLLHELAHLASATETSCLEGVGATSDADALERWCDSVASAAVLPRDALEAEVRTAARVDEPNFALVQQIASMFNVSLRATAVALIRAGLSGDYLYDEVEEKAPTGDFDKGFGRGVAQRAPRRRLGEVGPLAANAVLSALADHRLTERDARRYLRLDGAEIADLTREIGASP